MPPARSSARTLATLTCPGRLLAACAVVAVTAGAPARAEPRRVTVDEAVDLALQRDPALLAARARVDTADEAGKSVRGRLGVAVRLTNQFQHWDRSFDLDLLPPGTPEVPFEVRARNVNDFAASATQPLLGLARISYDYKAQRHLAEAEAQAARATVAAVREGVRVDYLRYFAAGAAREIAVSSERQLEEQLQVVTTRLEAGVLTRADVLRVRVAIATARQQQIQAEAQAEVALAGLRARLDLRVRRAAGAGGAGGPARRGDHLPAAAGRGGAPGDRPPP